MVTTIPDYRLKVEDVADRMPADMRWQLLRGELQIMSPAGFDHGRITIRLSAKLFAYVDKHRLGELCGAETGFILDRKPDSLLAPDIAFVSTARLPDGQHPGFYPGPPDLAVEVISPSETQDAARGKADVWLNAGTRAVWLVWPATQTVTVCVAGARDQTLASHDTLPGGDVLPGFACDVKDIFG